MRAASCQLPDKLPADHLNALLIWVCHGGAVLPFQWSYDSPFAVLCCGQRSFTLQVWMQEEIISTIYLKPCTNDTAEQVFPR
jgi:hypothetical protein